METTERIVEAYVRYVKGWATIPNVRCDGQNEINLLAIDLVSGARYHIEVSISISQSFHKLTGNPYDRETAKQRVQKPKQRRTVGFFVEQKFDAPTVIERLRTLGFEPGHYRRAIVTWGWDEAAAEQAAASDIDLWDFRDLIGEVADEIRGARTYFADDTLRTLNLFIHATEGAGRRPVAPTALPECAPMSPASTAGSGAERFWVYDNRVHNYACVHRASCPYCQDGRGTHGAGKTPNSEWFGPYVSFNEAWHCAERTNRRELRRCGSCDPTG